MGRRPGTRFGAPGNALEPTVSSFRWNGLPHCLGVGQKRVHIGRAGLDLTLLEGERIWTESSYKYTSDEVRRLLRYCGFGDCRQWIDEPGQFALTLAGV